ncbi:MAG: DUF1573 domain-containing protein [Bacteroidota bacterium]|nr:DUF1573 domain-containing protein [Bacteroidota bacterium]
MVSLTIRYRIPIVLFLMAVLGCRNGAIEKVPPSTVKNNDNQPVTSIKWIDSLVDLGKIPMGDTVLIRFQFINTGNQPVLVTKCISSCSCTRVIPLQEAIAPGAKGTILAVYDTRKSIVGTVYKGLLVTMNTNPPNRLLRYKAEVTGHKTLSGIY